MVNKNKNTKFNSKRLLSVLLLFILMSLLTSCAAQSSPIPINERWANVEGSQLNETQAGEQFYFNIPIDDALIAQNQPVTMKINGSVQNGSLRFELRSPDGEVVWNSGTINPGDFSLNADYDLPAGQTGTYQLGLVYGENTSATYNLGWFTIRLGLSLLVPGVGMLLVATAFIIYAAYRKFLGWSYLGLGALVWVLTVAAKFAWAIPVNPLVYRALGVTTENIFSPGNLAAYLYIGALTGIFEVGLAWLILSKVRWGKAAWHQALVFGIGFGVVEAYLLGFQVLSSALVGIFSPAALPIPTLASLANSASLVMGLAPVVERLSVIFAHIFSCVLIFYAITSGKSKWGWLAVLYKTLLDAPGGFAAFWGTGTVARIWTLEAVMAVFGLIGLFGTIWIAQRYTKDRRDQTSQTQPSQV
jgi:uncharacterized membrane protein YhfC